MGRRAHGSDTKAKGDANGDIGSPKGNIREGVPYFRHGDQSGGRTRSVIHCLIRCEGA